MATTTTTATLPDIVEVVKVCIPTLHHVPKGARTAWAKVLHHILTGASSCPTSLDHWTKLFTSPVRGNRLGWREIQSLVLSRIRRWESGDIAALWQLSLAESRSRSRSIHHPPLEKQPFDPPMLEEPSMQLKLGNFTKPFRL